MKRYLYLLLIVTGVSYGQEFSIHSNGLIYDEATMNKLGHIVDSLNLKFRTCDVAQSYYSYPQGFATFVEVPSKAARKLIDEGATLEEYSRVFHKSVKERLWIIKYNYCNYDEQQVIEYSALPYGYGQELSITTAEKDKNDKTFGWVLDDNKTIAVFLENLTTYELPLSYARLVQYVDCMIDTTTTIYLTKSSAQTYQQVKSGSKADQFLQWAIEYPGQPDYPDYEKLDGDAYTAAYESYVDKYQIWDSARIKALDNKLRNALYWKSLLMEARDEAMATGNSDNKLEFYVARYLSKEDALQLKRSRRVMGYCSQDQSPRYHAISICQLAAETAKWDIFLRSHLDIMNDRFERQSDGSYAWAERQTYLKELEELDIAALDLLLGTSLRVHNVGEQHYFSSIGRTGRALADAEDKDALEKQLISMIKDEMLDPYNRLLMAYVFDNYSGNLTDEKRKLASQQKLKEVMSDMPSFIKHTWDKE